MFALARMAHRTRNMPQSDRSNYPSRDIEFRVRYAETDQMGVVYHANYLVWCEMGRTEYIRTLGVSYAEMERAGIALAVAEAHVRFHASARYDNLIRVTTTISAARSRAVAFDYVVSNAETDERLATAQTTLVSIDGAGRPTSLPAEFRKLFEPSR